MRTEYFLRSHASHDFRGHFGETQTCKRERIGEFGNTVSIANRGLPPVARFPVNCRIANPTRKDRFSA